MKTILWFLYFGMYLVYAQFKKGKISELKKKGSKKDLEDYVHAVAAKWGRDLCNKTGSKVTVIGEENLPMGNCLFVGNHQGNFDIPLLFGFIKKPMGFIAKKEMEKIPVMNFWMKELHCIAMDRENIRESIKSINEGVEYLKQGYSMAIFPEGTRSRGMTLGEFKQGSMKLAIKSGVPIVPVTIIGSYKMFEEKGNRIKKAEVQLILSKSIDPKSLTKEEQNNLGESVKKEIQRNLDKYTLSDHTLTKS